MIPFLSEHPVIRCRLTKTDPVVTFHLKKRQRCGARRSLFLQGLEYDNESLRRMHPFRSKRYTRFSLRNRGVYLELHHAEFRAGEKTDLRKLMCGRYAPLNKPLLYRRYNAHETE